MLFFDVAERWQECVVEQSCHQHPKKGNERFLFPVSAMKSVYRALFMKGLHEQIAAKTIRLPPDFSLEKRIIERGKIHFLKKIGSFMQSDHLVVRSKLLSTWGVIRTKSLSRIIVYKTLIMKQLRLNKRTIKREVTRKR